jgi:hypothetical protein
MVPPEPNEPPPPVLGVPPASPFAPPVPTPPPDEAVWFSKCGARQMDAAAFTRKRRRNLGAPEPGIEPSGLDPLGQLVSDHRARVRPGDALASKAERDLAFRRALESEDDDPDSDPLNI